MTYEMIDKKALLLICALSKNPEVNFIEMTRGYVNKVKRLVNELV